MQSHPLITDYWTPELDDQIVLRSIADCDMVPDERLQMWASKQLENITALWEANPEIHGLSLYEVADILTGAMAVNSLGFEIDERFLLVAAWCPQAEIIADCVTISQAVTDLLGEQLRDLTERLAVNLLEAMAGCELIESLELDVEEL